MLKGKLFLFLGLLASTRSEIPEPEDLSAIEIRSTKVVIKWKMATNDTQYKMSVETTDSPSPNKPPDDDNDLESEVEVEELTNGNNLQPNTNYKLYLFAINKTNSADFNMSSITFTTAPAAPYMVTIKQAYVHELDVTWQHKATDRTMKYEVSYRGDSNGKEPRIKETEGKEKYLKLIGLDSNSKYIVSVSALTEDERIFSDDSAATSRSTGIRKPDSPRASGASASSMNVTWHMTTGGGAAAITGYKVYWDPPHNEGNKNVNGASENATQISGLTPSTSYELYVVVVTAESDGPFSNTTTAVTLPDAPLDVKVSRPTVDDDTTVKRGIIVQWKPPRGGNLIEDYVVDWMPFSAGNHSSSHGNYSSSQLIPHNSKNASFQYSIQYLTPGTKYKIQVKAGNVAGMGERSSPQYYRIDPAVPTNVLATKTTSNTTVVLWSIPTGVYDGYKIYRVKGKNRFEQMRQGRPENVSMHSYQLRGLEENTPYVFAVTAISGTDDEETPAESEKSRPTATYTLPGVPTNITLSLGNDRTTEVIIDFDEPRNGAKSYYVILNATDEVPVEINTDKLPIFQNLLNPGQTYDVTILAIGDGGEGEISPVHSITMEPPSPTNPNVEEFNADSIEITWDLPLDTDSIWDTQVIRYFDAEDKSSAKNISLDRNITSYKFTGLTSGMSYTIQLFTVSNQLFSEDTTLSQTTELRPPTKLQLVRHTTDTLVVRWLTPSGDVVFDKFLLEYSLLDEMRMDVDTKSINIPENTTEAVLSGLRAGSVYEVSIKTLGEEESDPVTRQFPTIPNPVNNLKVTQKSSNPSRALLVEWNQPEGAGDSIIVDYHGFPSNTKDSREIQFESTKLSLTVLPGNNYTISVKVSSIGSWSTPQTFNISSKPATVNFDAKPHMRMLALSWKKLQGFAEQIIVQPFAENISQKVVLNINETAYNITDLDPNSSYKIQMYSQMYNVEGSLENSEITTKTFKTSAVPIAKLDAPVVTGVSSSSITLKWTAAPVSEDSETVNGYRLMWQPPFNNGAKDVEGHDTVSTTISGLQANTLYNVSLFALTPTGSGPTSDLVAATTGIGTPQNVVAANATFRSFVLNWTRVVDGALTINGYSISWTSSLTNGSTHINGGNVTRTRITGLYPNTRYSVKIAANTINGYREFSKPVSVETKLQGPGNLIITGSTTTALNITWRGCEGKVISLTGYRLVWTPSTNGGEKKVDGVAINTTVVEGLNPNTNYNISVQVLTADGPGPQSSQSTATTKCGAPEKLLVRRPLDAEGDSTSSVFVNWIKPEGGDDILDYVVDRRVFSGSDIVSSIPLSHEKGKTSYNVTLKFLTPGQKYAFTVKARNLAGVSLPSKEEIYRTNPGRPQNLRVTSKTSTSIILAWDKPQFAFWSYSAFFALASKNLAAIPENQLVNLSSTSYQVTGLKPNTEYDFALTSVSGDDTTTAESAKTEVKSSYTLPGTPTNIKVVLGHRRAHDVVVSFSPPQYGATGYSALLLTVGESPARNSSNTSPVHVNQLTPGQTYNVIVEAYGEAGTGAASEKSSITLAPAPGNGLMVEKFAANYIFTKWNLPVSLNSVYDRQMVTYKVSENSAGPVKTYLNKSTTSYNITGLTSGMNYTIEVFCLSKDLFSVPITLHHATEILGPTNLHAVNQTANSIQIKWTAAPGVVVFKKYMVEYSSLDESGLPTEPKSIDVTKDKTTANITGLEGGNIYFMSVKSVGTRTSEPVSENFFTRPSPVRNLTVTRSPENPTKKIYVTWETPSGSGENISMSYVSFPTDTKKTKYVQFNENETFFDALPGYFYFVTVKVNNFKMSSDEMSVEISSKPAKPSYKVKASVKELQITWDKPEGHFEKIFIRSISNDSFPDANLSSSASSYTISNLTPYTEYTMLIYTVSSAFGNNVETSAHSPVVYRTLAARPEFPNVTTPLDEDAKTTSNVITFVLPENSFNDKNGPIEYYAVYITPAALKASDTSSTQPDVTRNDTCEHLNVGGVGECVILWTDSQGRPTTRFNDTMGARNRRSIESPVGNPEIRFTLGTGNKTRSPWRQMFLNIRLLPGTEYLVSVAAKTENQHMTATNWSQAIATRPDVVLIVGIVIAAFVAIILVITFAVIYVKRRKKRKEERAMMMMPTVFSNNLDIMTERRRTKSKAINLSDFSYIMQTMRADSDLKFAEEYDEFKSIGCEQSKNAALLTENHGKNRYTNIIPYDATRVKLGGIDDVQGSDYINANFIPGFSSQREYIATQGPLPSTKDDFWRMIWEQNSRNIVMITQTVERGRIKCEHYWPFDNEPTEVGDLTIQMTSESILPEWTIREFKLTHRNLLKVLFKGRDSRRIRQFQYTAWPDHGVPDTPENFIQFIHQVRRTIDREAKHTGPTTVHCSAGVGRTGTFIAMDRLIQHMREHTYVDIYGIVYQMRKHRPFMMQTEGQYIFIHQMVQDINDGKYKEFEDRRRKKSLPGEELEHDFDHTKM